MEYVQLNIVPTHSGSFLRNGKFREAVFVNSGTYFFAIPKETLIFGQSNNYGPPVIEKKQPKQKTFNKSYIFYCSSFTQNASSCVQKKMRARVLGL